MSDLIIGPLGAPWITQATWIVESPREASFRRREGDRDRKHTRRGRKH